MIHQTAPVLRNIFVLCKRYNNDSVIELFSLPRRRSYNLFSKSFAQNMASDRNEKSVISFFTVSENIVICPVSARRRISPQVGKLGTKYLPAVMTLALYVS